MMFFEAYFHLWCLSVITTTDDLLHCKQYIYCSNEPLCYYVVFPQQWTLAHKKDASTVTTCYKIWSNQYCHRRVYTAKSVWVSEMSPPAPIADWAAEWLSWLKLSGETDEYKTYVLICSDSVINWLKKYKIKIQEHTIKIQDKHKLVVLQKNSRKNSRRVFIFVLLLHTQMDHNLFSELYIFSQTTTHFHSQHILTCVIIYSHP